MILRKCIDLSNIPIYFSLIGSSIYFFQTNNKKSIYFPITLFVLILLVSCGYFFANLTHHLEN
jgi:hypothetical protein